MTLAGTGATASPVTGAAEMSGTIFFKAGTLPSASAAMLTITFAVAFAGIPNVFLSPSPKGSVAIAEATAALSGAGCPWGNSTAAAMSIYSNTIGLASSANYAWNYFIVG